MMDIEYIKECVMCGSASAVVDEIISAPDEFASLRQYKAEAESQNAVARVDKAQRDELLAAMNEIVSSLDGENYQIVSRAIAKCEELKS